MKGYSYCLNVVRALAAVVTLSASMAYAVTPGAPSAPDSEENDIFFRTPWDGKVVGTGAQRPDAAQWAWAEEHMVKAKHVRLNPLGLARVNAARAARGLRPLEGVEANAVAVGAEPQAAAPAGSGSTMAAAALPTYVDNSALPYFPPIRSQGSLNSCAQFSAVYYTLTHMTAMARNWDAKGGGDQFRFSPKWTYNMINGGENVGSQPSDAYAIAQKHGLATWAALPYDGNYRAWSVDPSVWRDAIFARADQTGKVLDVDADAGLGQLKQLLVNGYVLNFATYINSWQWKAIGNDPTTSADDAFAGKQCVAMVNGTSGGHAMTIVGFNDDLWVDANGNGLVDTGEKGALRIANSWGTSWGEAGYCWISYQALRTRNPAFTAEGVFWYDQATWVTARADYQPRLIAEFTVNQLTRNQLLMTLGLSDTAATTPAVQWYPNRVLSKAGGAWSFDGLSTAIDGTFCLDFTDLLPSTAGNKRYFLGLNDSAAGNPAQLKSYKLVDLEHGVDVPCSDASKTADGSQAYAYVDYNFGTGSLAPSAVLNANPTSGNISLTVAFDASGSTDVDGTIASYAWNFGDGSTGTGAITQHIYTKAGTYIATLTVTDNTGVQSSSTVSISAVDPNLINTPSTPSATIFGKSVTLIWLDNATNESGYYVERAVKVSKGTPSYSRVGSVGANMTRYSETVSSDTYLYRLQGFNSATGSLSAYSGSVSIRVR